MVNSIFENINITKYLRSLLSPKLQKKVYQNIQTLYSVLKIDIKTTLLENSFNENTKILVYTNVAGMRVDISNTKCVI